MATVRLAGRYPAAALMLGAAFFAACAGADPETTRPPEHVPANNGTAQSAPNRTGGSFTAAATADAVSFHPFKTTDTASSSYQGLIYAGGLLVRNPRNIDEFVGELAESWILADDKVTYTFRLRPDIRWSDGHPITSADFKWTFAQARIPENAYPYVNNFEPIASYEAPDPRTVVVTLTEPLAVGLENADAVNPLPKHIWEIGRASCRERV